MNTMKKVILTGALTVATVSIMATCSQATTVKVTGDTINVRKGASTSSEVIAMLSKGVECELLEEVDGWYKIKYKSYTGYISKDYSKKVEDNSSQNSESPNLSGGNNNETSDNKNNETTNNNEANNQSTNSQTTDNQTTNNETTNNQTTNSQNNDENANNSNSENVDNNSETESNNSDVEEPREVKVVYKKFLQNTDVKILPLIYSSEIGNVKKGVEVIVITETTGGWSYIQTDTFNGWVRTSSLGEAKTVTTTIGGTTATEDNDTSEEKVGYVNEQGVNLRKGAGTNYNVVKVLYLNTKVTILKEEGTWYQVKAGNDTGYISKEFVSDTKITSTRGNSNPRTLDDEEKEKSDNTIIIGATETNKDLAENATKTTTTSTSKTNSDNSSSKATTNSDNASSKTTTNGANASNKEETTTQKTETKSTETQNSNTSKTEETSKDSKNESTSSKSINASEVISYAKKYLGCKYVYGGDGSNKTFDCSGFTMYVFKNFGISLPHGATSQYNSGKGTKITKQSDLKAGDIVFLTDYETGVGIGHCGIYIGDGEFIHASTTTYTVTISSLNTMYKGRFYAGLRVI